MDLSTLTENKSFNNQSSVSIATQPAASNNFKDNSKPDSNQAESIEKILSSSIQRAKQKITMLEGRQRDERSQNKPQRASSRDGHNNAVASAMKVLQARVHELELSIENHERERTIVLKELDNMSNEKKLLLNNLEEANRKVNSLEQTQKNNKTQIKELTRQLEDCQTDKSNIESQCQTLEMSVRHLEKDKQQLASQLARKEQEFARKEQELALKSSLPPSHKQHSQKNLEIETKQRILADRERKIQEKEKKLVDFEQSLRQKEAILSSEYNINSDASRQNEQLRNQIISLRQQLSEDNQKQSQERESYEVYLNKIKEMEDQLHYLRETTKHFSSQQNIQQDHQEIEIMKDNIAMLQNKNEELLRVYKRVEDKSKRQEKQIKNQKEKIRDLEDLLTQMVQKIGKLPTTTKDLKYLSVKAGKIFSSNLRQVTTLKTPTKSRSNSLNRSLSRSASQRRNTQTSQLNNSRTSNKQMRSGSKSKRKNITSNSGTKSKRVVVSQVGPENLEKEVNQLKKEYKKLVKILNETQDEEIRNRLNEIAFSIQEKNERSTKQRQLGRLK